MSEKNSNNHSSKKHLKIVLLGAIAAVSLIFYCTKDKNVVTNIAEPVSQQLDTVKILAGVDALQKALVSGNTDSVASLMTETARALYADDLAALTKDECLAIATALDSKTLIHAGPTLAEYALSIDGLTYTIGLTPGKDGAPWLLVRF